MKCQRTAIVVTVFFISLFCSVADVSALSAKISPGSVFPGDAFIIRWEGKGVTRPPVAEFDNRQIRFYSCGRRCYFGLGSADLETAPGIYRIKVKSHKSSRRLKLIVRKPDFPVISMRLPEEKVFPPPEDEERIAREDQKMKELWQAETDRLWKGRFIIPLDNEISTVFGVKRIMNEKKVSVHRGIDIRGSDGEDVMASNNGRVVLAEELFYGGNTIVLNHGAGVFSVYMHLSAMSVKVDDQVSKGDIIGLVGSTGRASGPHLHFSMKLGDRSINPVSLLRLKMRI